jgi:hypothetical protein
MRRYEWTSENHKWRELCASTIPILVLNTSRFWWSIEFHPHVAFQCVGTIHSYSSLQGDNLSWKVSGCNLPVVNINFSIMVVHLLVFIGIGGYHASPVRVWFWTKTMMVTCVPKSSKVMLSRLWRFVILMVIGGIFNYWWYPDGVVGYHASLTQ